MNATMKINERGTGFMKRVLAACLNQTVHFQLKDDIVHDAAVKYVKEEYAGYKAMLEHNHIQYKIVDEKVQDDGSIVIVIKKQHGDYDVGTYLD